MTLEIGLPRTAARRQILQRRWNRLAVSEELLDAAAEATRGLSGAQVQEVAVRALQTALLRGAVDGREQAALSVELVALAAGALTGRTPRTIGFGATQRA